MTNSWFALPMSRAHPSCRTAVISLPEVTAHSFIIRRLGAIQDCCTDRSSDRGAGLHFGHRWLVKLWYQGEVKDFRLVYSIQKLRGRCPVSGVVLSYEPHTLTGDHCDRVWTLEIPFISHRQLESVRSHLKPCYCGNRAICILYLHTVWTPASSYNYVMWCHRFKYWHNCWWTPILYVLLWCVCIHE